MGASIVDVDTLSGADTSTVSPFLLSVCSFLSATVLMNTFFYKAPQVYEIVASGSSRGVSLTSVLLEWIAYNIMLTYHHAMGYPLETYIEVVLMVLQDFLLVFVIMANRGLVDWKFIPHMMLYTLGMCSIGFKWLPDSLLYICIAATTPILCWSKVDQLIEILWTKDPGSLSAISWFIAVYDTGVRIFTTIIITKDMPMFINLTSSEVLNVAVWVSILYYNHKKRQAGWKPPGQQS